MILEGIRSQQRALIESIDAMRQSLEQRLERFDEESRKRYAALEMAIREISVDARAMRKGLPALMD